MNDLPNNVIDEAIVWTVKLHYNTPTAMTMARFDEWLHRHPTHSEAWKRVSSIQGDHAKVPAKLARATLTTLQQQRQADAHARRRVLKVFGFTTFAIGSGWLTHEHTPWQRIVADASTGIGQQRLLNLSDGTFLTLNTDTAVSTRMDGSKRVVELHRGEIRIQTGQDEAHINKRPFFVYTPFGPIQAIGTTFTVRLREHGAQVAVQEGTVRLFPIQGTNSTLVQEGESQLLTHSGTEKITQKTFEPASWTEGVIAGENIRLEELLNELARYRPGIVRCDPRVADLRVSGIFQIKQTDKTLQFLADTQNLSLTYRTRYWVTIAPEKI